MSAFIEIAIDLTFVANNEGLNIPFVSPDGEAKAFAGFEYSFAEANQAKRFSH